MACSQIGQCRLEFPESAREPSKLLLGPRRHLDFRIARTIFSLGSSAPGELPEEYLVDEIFSPGHTFHVATVIFGDFEWHDSKAESNVQKHNVTLEDAIEAYMDPLGLDVPDLLHPKHTLSIGRSSAGILVVVTCAIVESERTRIISARKATPIERRKYMRGLNA